MPGAFGDAASFSVLSGSGIFGHSPCFPHPPRVFDRAARGNEWVGAVCLGMVSKRNSGDCIPKRSLGTRGGEA